MMKILLLVIVSIGLSGQGILNNLSRYNFLD